MDFDRPDVRAETFSEETVKPEILRAFAQAGAHTTLLATTAEKSPPADVSPE